MPLKLTRHRTLVRSWRLIILLRSAPDCTLDRLSRELGVTTRTIRRDLQALQDAGLEIEDGRETDAPVRRWRLVKDAPCAICGRGLAMGQQDREARARSSYSTPSVSRTHE